MTTPRRRLVVMGIMGQVPFAGVAWQTLHYLEGVRRLGHEVHYVEDTRQWPYDPERDAVTDDPRHTVEYLARVMAWCGLPDRWAYRFEPEGGRVFGLSDTQLSDVLDRADAVIDLHGSMALRPEYLRVPVRIYVETDPVRPQIQVAKGDAHATRVLAAHTHHFTFAEHLGAPDCRIPVVEFSYRPTRQPVVVDWWQVEGDDVPRIDDQKTRFTTVTNWKQTGKDVVWEGETYAWSKHLEFLRFLDLPRRTSSGLELALASRDSKVINMLTFHGWRIVDAVALSTDILPYRDYIQGSRGEFTVAKDQYVRPLSGWFSDRSATYLAAGRPVITQETGFSRHLPTGRGLFAFRTLDDALAALDAIERDWPAHCRAALEIAAEYFRAEKVVGEILDQAGL
jgi:hypothetical protein